MKINAILNDLHLLLLLFFQIFDELCRKIVLKKIFKYLTTTPKRIITKKKIEKKIDVMNRFAPLC